VRWMEEGEGGQIQKAQIVSNEHDSHEMKKNTIENALKREKRRARTSKRTSQRLDGWVVDMCDKAGTIIKRRVGRLVLPLEISRAEEGLLGPLGVFQDVGNLDVHGGEAATRGRDGGSHAAAIARGRPDEAAHKGGGGKDAEARSRPGQVLEGAHRPACFFELCWWCMCVLSVCERRTSRGHGTGTSAGG